MALNFIAKWYPSISHFILILNLSGIALLYYSRFNAFIQKKNLSRNFLFPTILIYIIIFALHYHSIYLYDPKSFSGAGIKEYTNIFQQLFDLQSQEAK